MANEADDPVFQVRVSDLAKIVEDGIGKIVDDRVQQGIAATQMRLFDNRTKQSQSKVLTPGQASHSAGFLKMPG